MGQYRASWDMQAKKERGTKTETLSLRLDPKTKFILEFASRINGQTITTIVERAIRASCDEVQINDGNENDFAEIRNWKDFWDPDEGIRTLKLLASRNYPTTYDEDELKSFTEAHRDFFFYTGKRIPNSPLVQVLWPKIENYRRIWLEQRDKDYWAAGNAMVADLTSAKVKPPSWPPTPLPPSPPLRRVGVEDEIPF